MSTHPNHSSSKWCGEQLREAEKYGTVTDIPFPEVDPVADESEIKKLAVYYAEKISAMDPTAVLCQGEMSLSYSVTKLLKEKNITVLCACAERVSCDSLLPNGTVNKISAFRFVRFRKY